MERTKEQERGMLKKTTITLEKNFWKELGFNLGRLNPLMPALTSRSLLPNPRPTKFLNI